MALALAIVANFPVAAAIGQEVGPRLPEIAIKTTNLIQRAIFACVSGSAAFGNPLKAGANDYVELGYNLRRDPKYYPLLVLDGTTLSGTGRIERDSGKTEAFNFTCGLTADLAQATAFSVRDLAPMPKPSRDMVPLSIIFDPDAAVWAADTASQTNTLTHGVPETDDRNVTMQCAAGSGMVSWYLPLATASWIADQQVLVGLYTTPGNFEGGYVATIQPDDQSGLIARADIAADDPLFDWIIADEELNYFMDNYSFAIPLKGSAAPTKEFVASCAKEATQ